MPTDVTQLVTAVIDAAPGICTEAAEGMGRDIQLSAPIGDTGMLSREWNVQTSGGSTAVSTLTFTADYASFQDDPPAGPIHGNPLLSFNWNGVQVIVHSVKVNPVNKGWFSDKAEDESLWGLLVQAAADGTVIT